MNAYLEHQGRNENINLATQVGYDGANIAFVFFENQVRRLMNESPYDERKLEVLRQTKADQADQTALADQTARNGESVLRSHAKYDHCSTY